MKMRYKSGFTLIELLVVISIIAMLSSVILASLNTAQMKARDAKRALDINQIQTALEEFYDTNGYYPVSTCPSLTWASFDSQTYSPNPLCNTKGTQIAANLTAALAPYISKEADPKSLGGDSGYLYMSSAGADYCILFWRTPEDMRDFGSALIDTASGRCSIITNGQCAPTGANSIYIGTGQYAGGC